MQPSSIEWTDCTWNPVRGCTRVSPGCVNCYAETTAGRFCKPGGWAHGFAERTAAGSRWTGQVELRDKLREPTTWREPRRIFVNSMSDLFHESLSFWDIGKVVAVMAACPQHTFQTLTKRASRMREWFEWALVEVGGARPLDVILESAVHEFALDQRPEWPLENWWLGVSAEDQERWNERVPELLECPAAVRFVSCEPLLGPIDCTLCFSPDWLINPLSGSCAPRRSGLEPRSALPKLDWIIVGAETGHGARPMELAWVQAIDDQCEWFETAFFMKQFATPGGRKITDSEDWPESFPRELPQ